MEVDPAIVPDEPVHTVKETPKPSDEKPVDVPAHEPDVEEPEAEIEEKAEEEVVEERRPRSGYARLKARHQALIAEVEQLKRQSTPTPTEKEPTVEDFNGDYLAYERAAVAFEARKAIRDELGKAREVEAQVKAQEAQQEDLDNFFEKWNDLEAQMPDAKEAVDKLYATIGPLNPVARNLIADADNGEVILYYLAKNPGQARQLNSLPPIEAAKMIGQLEAKTTLPKAKTETKAPPPIKAPKGGASPPRDLHSAAAKSENITDYVKMRQAMMKKD